MQPGAKHGPARSLRPRSWSPFAEPELTHQAAMEVESTARPFAGRLQVAEAAGLVRAHPGRRQLVLGYQLSGPPWSPCPSTHRERCGDSGYECRFQLTDQRQDGRQQFLPVALCRLQPGRQLQEGQRTALRLSQQPGGVPAKGRSHPSCKPLSITWSVDLLEGTKN